MSKEVRSDKKVQKLLLAALDDEAVNSNRYAGFLTSHNLNQVDLESLMIIKQKIQDKWPNCWATPQGVFFEAIPLIDEFIAKRKKQSSRYREGKTANTYDILLQEEKPVSTRKPGEAKPEEEAELESPVENWDNLRKASQLLDCGGKRPKDYLVEKFHSLGDVEKFVEWLLEKLGERHKAVWDRKRCERVRSDLMALEQSRIAV